MVMASTRGAPREKWSKGPITDIFIKKRFLPVKYWTFEFISATIECATEIDFARFSQ